jgi:hypothetical protein
MGNEEPTFSLAGKVSMVTGRSLGLDLGIAQGYFGTQLTEAAFQEKEHLA